MGNLVRVQARKWQVTINNPLEHGFSHSLISSKLDELKGLVYACFCDEIGDECETLHTHIYIQTRSAITADRVNNLFPNCHREIAHGTPKDNRAYIRKEGEKFNRDDSGHYSYIDGKGKAHEGVNLGDTFGEIGEAPDEHQGRAKDSDVIVNMIRDGASDADIVDAVSGAYSRLEHIRQTRSMYHDEPFKKNWRDLTVVYMFGKTGLGKTRYVMETHGYENVYRVTDYRRYPWDDYNGEDVVLMEEYRSSFSIGDILKYLDGYPLRLSARFSNKQACYTKVYICTNDLPEMQYRNVDEDSLAAFWRRVSEIREYTALGSFNRYKSLDDYKARLRWVHEAETAPTAYKMGVV